MELENLYRCPPQLLEPIPNHRIFFACKRGRSHVAAKKVCQDYCIAEKINNEIFVVAVADGHGGDSYVKSDIGSKIACNVVVDLAKKYSKLISTIFSRKLCSSEFKEELFDTWRINVLNDYRTENPDTQESDAEIIKKYGTTLLFAVVNKNSIIIGQIGDGAILLFNDQYQYQLFKRHNPKFDSKTSSLASGRGIYSLVIESYNYNHSFKFNKFLLSTDGIYDKLDKENFFAVYAAELAENVKNKTNEEIQPFAITVQNNIKDISEISSDDCTIALIVLPPTGTDYDINFKNKTSDLTNLKFERSYNRLEIYSATKNKLPFEVHLSKYVLKNDYSFEEFDGKVKLLSPVSRFSGSGNVFELPQNVFRIQELIENGEHLEKKYISDDEISAFSNEFWLNFYKLLSKMKKVFEDKNYFIDENFFKTMMISEEGEVFLFADCLSKAVFYKSSSPEVFENEKSYFGFLGEIKCREKTLPLFKSSKYSWGQIVPALHTAEGENFCRVVYNPKFQSYGLQNLSEKIWMAENKQILPNQYLSLTKDWNFKISENVEYEIKLFVTE